jgi:hypothetical protein
MIEIPLDGGPNGVFKAKPRPPSQLRPYFGCIDGIPVVVPGAVSNETDEIVTAFSSTAVKMLIKMVAE